MNKIKNVNLKMQSDNVKLKMNYHFHWKAATYPLVVNELCSNRRDNYGQFEYIILLEGDLATSYCSDVGVRQQYDYGKENLFDKSKSQLIFERIKKLDNKLKNFTFKEDAKSENLEVKRGKWLIFYREIREIIIDFGKIYFVMEAMPLAPLAEFIEKICERDGLLQDQVLHNISLAKNFSKEKKRLAEELIELGKKKLLLHAGMEPVMLGLYQLYRFIAQAGKISLNQILMITDGEITKFLKTGTLNFRAIKNRDSGAVLIIGKRNSIFKIVGGSEYKKWKKILEPEFSGEIKGIVASRGKARGRVSLHLSWIHTRKIPKGNILVTGMTNPQMVPFLKNVAAIVTDEGGLTCHAAIISRELGIPCIVGTKMATRVLRDGDYVEVDANRGIVKKIKK